MTDRSVTAIALSGQFGSGVSTVGAGLARRLGFDLFDDKLVRQIAGRAHTSLEAADLYNRMPAGRMHALVSLLGWPVEVVSRAEELPSAERHVERSIVDATDSLIRGLAERGRAIICGRGGAWILSRGRLVLRVHLVGDEDGRRCLVAEGDDRLGSFGSVAAEDPRNLIRRVDRSRASYVRQFHGGDVDRASAYDLTVDSVNLGWAATVTLIEQAAGLGAADRSGANSG